MADKSFGVKQVNLINASGTPRIESPNNLNINAVNVAISTDISVGGQLSLGTGTSISSPGSNILTLGTNSVERVRITSSGNVGIGTDNPTVFGTAYRTLQLNPAAGTGDGSAIRFMYDGGTANTNDLVIYTNSSQSYIRANGARNLDIMRNGSTVATFNANGIALPSGLGIDFSATSDGSGTTTSELLDDYEEGTWTPVFNGTTGNPTLTYSSGYPWGKYTKIGNLVTIAFELRTTARSGGSGNISITGLPFTPPSSQFTGIAEIYNVDLDVNAKYVISYINNDSTIRFDQVRDNDTSIVLPVSAWATGSLCIIGSTMTYMV